MDLQNKKLERLKASIFIENEIRFNHLLGFVLFFLAGLYLLCGVFNFIGILEGDFPNNYKIYFGITLILFAGIAIARLMSKKAFHVVKIILLGTLIISNTITAFYFYVFSRIIFSMPIFLSVCYYNKKVPIFTSILVWIGLFCSIDFSHSIYLANPSFSVILQEIIIPHTWVIALLMTIAIIVADSGRKQINKQAEKTFALSAVESEIALSARIQSSVLPPQKFISPNKAIELNAAIFPAKEVAGDFYDYFMIDDSNLAFLVADVSDKGLPAAMFMMQARDSIKNLLQSHKSIKKAANQANKYLTQNNQGDMFVTVWMGCINIHTGIGKYVNAGHLPPVIKRNDGSLELLENEPDLFMGAFEDSDYSSHTFRLKKNESLVLFTDGVTDAQNEKNKEFGIEKLKEAIAQSETSSQSMFDKVSKSVLDFSKNNLFDDITILTLHNDADCIPTTLDIETEAKTENITKVIDEVNSLLAKVNCPEYTRKNVDVIIDEICVNIADYAYDGGNGNMALKCYAAENFLRMDFEDSGKEFNPLDTPAPDEDDILNIGGFGIHFVKNLADEVLYERIDGKNRLIVRIVWIA